MARHRRRRLTLPSRGRPQAGFAHLRPPLMSNVRALGAGAITLHGRRGPPRSGRRTARSSPSRFTVAFTRLCACPPKTPSPVVQASIKMQGLRGLRKVRFLVKPNRKVLSEFAPGFQLNASALSCVVTAPSAESRVQSAAENRLRQAAILGAVGRQFVPFTTSALTRQSTGHPTAGHNGALRLGRAAVGCRLPLR